MVVARVVVAHVVMARAQRASVTAGAAAASLQEPLARAAGGTIFPPFPAVSRHRRRRAYCAGYGRAGTQKMTASAMRSF